MKGDSSVFAATLATPGFTGRQVSVELVRNAKIDDSDLDVGTQLFVTASSGETLKFEVEGGRANLYVGSDSVPASTVMPLLAPHRFIRIRELTGAVLFESTDNARAGWSIVWFATTPTWLANVNRVALGVYNGRGDGGTTMLPAIFDNLNRCP
jgi:hypothetical protein